MGQGTYAPFVSMYVVLSSDLLFIPLFLYNGYITNQKLLRGDNEFIG